MTTPKQQAATVLLVDDHPLMRQGLRTLLESEADLTVVGEAADGEEALEQVRALSPDVVVMDITMPNLNGIEATRRILADAPGTRVVALSIHAEKRFVDDMLKAGAVAYVLKDSVPEELVRAIHTVLKGESFLSAPILASVVAGYHKPADESATAASEETAETAVISAEPVLQTKLHPPVQPVDLVPRANLIERLEAERARPLTLVSAPAGYGKSLLIGSWLERSDWPGAWLSLDEDDSELRQFLVYFVAAVRSLFPQACEDSLELAMRPELPRVPRLAAVLSNELDMLEQPFIVVLDDYHLISVTSPVNELLHLLLVRPPIPLHLVILSRRDPALSLVTLRASGQVTEVGTLDLRFSKPETRSLLEKTLGYTASDAVLARLEGELEGWVVGLQLMSLAARRLEDPEAFLAQLHGGIQGAQEYMVHEVIDRLPPGLREWLLKSAILDRFCGSLCDAVCAKRDDAETSPLDGGRFLRTLLDDNLFVIPLDIQGEWFRYHHMFRDLLQSVLIHQLAADEIAALHMQASQWFESHGFIDEAIQHALEAGEKFLAAGIVERHCYAELDQDRWYVLDRWLDKLPSAISKQRPVLLLAHAWVVFFQQQIGELASIITDAELLLDDESADGSLSGELDFFRGYLLYWAGKGEQSQHRFEAALDRIPENKGLIRGEVELHVALARCMSGQGALAIQALSDRIRNPGRTGSRQLSRLIGGLAIVQILAGDLSSVQREARNLRALTGDGHSLLIEAWSYYLEACTDLHGLHLEPALEHFAAGTRHPYATDAYMAIDAFAGLALTQQLMHQADAATETIARLMNFVLERDDPVEISVARSCEARVSLLQGRLSQAIQWARPVNGPAEPFDLFIWLEAPLLTRARILIVAGTTDDLNKAMELLREIRDLSEACRFANQVIEVAVLQSLALEKQGHSDAALESLEEAVALAEPGGWVRPFVELGQPMAGLLERFADQKGRTEFLRRVLDQFQVIQAQPASAAAGKPQSGAAWSGGPLTNRELDILELVAQGLQNKEMATRLFVSPETVKTHLKHLYQKLGVSNRRDAAARSAEILSTTRSVARPSERTETQ